MLGNILRDRLSELGLSQEAFGLQIGATQAQVSEWINGKRKPRRRTLERIAEGLQLPVSELEEASARSPRQPHEKGKVRTHCEVMYPSGPCGGELDHGCVSFSQRLDYNPYVMNAQYCLTCGVIQLCAPALQMRAGTTTASRLPSESAV